jgi:hypothetical protein
MGVEEHFIALAWFGTQTKSRLANSFMWDTCERR